MSSPTLTTRDSMKAATAIVVAVAAFLIVRTPRNSSQSAGLHEAESDPRDSSESEIDNTPGRHNAFGTAGGPAPALSELRPVYFARDPAQWQGMLVDLNFRAPCEARDACGLGLACIDGRCNPCTADAHCPGGEVCVLDHCVHTELAGCRSPSDCASGDMCVLSGLSAGKPRGNEDMRAYCLGSSGGIDQRPEDIDLGPGEPAGPPLFEAEPLVESARLFLREHPEP